MNNGNQTAAVPQMGPPPSYQQLIEDNADLSELLSNNPLLSEQFSALNAQAERNLQKARLHAPLDSLTAMTIWALQTTNPDQLVLRVNDVVGVLEAALAELQVMKVSWAQNDPPQQGTCSPQCEPPTPHCDGSRCVAYE